MFLIKVDNGYLEKIREDFEGLIRTTLNMRTIKLDHES